MRHHDLQPPSSVRPHCLGSFPSTACWRELAAADSSSLVEHAVVRGNGRADHDAERRRRAAKGDGLTNLDLQLSETSGPYIRHVQPALDDLVSIASMPTETLIGFDRSTA